MIFLRPEALWCLVLLIPYAVVEAACAVNGSKTAALLAPGAESAGARRAWTRRRIGKAMAGAWAWGFAVAALAGPSWGFESYAGMPTGAEAALVIDASHSMLSTDIAPTRLDAARGMARALVRAIPELPFSVTTLRGDAVLLAPVTDNHEAVQQALDWAIPSAVTARGTSIAAGIRKALSGFSPDLGRVRHIVLFSDGNDLAGGVVQAVREAREAGVRILTVGSGGPAAVPALDESGTPVKLPDGSIALTALRPDVLRQWARESGGLYVDLMDPASLNILADALDRRSGYPDGGIPGRPAERTGLAAILALLGAAGRAFLGLPAPHRGAVPPRGRRARKASAALLAAVLLGGCTGPRMRVLMGNRLADRGRYEEAIASYLAAGKGQGDGVVELALATVYSRLGQGEAADPLYARAQASGRGEVAAAAFHNQGVRLFEAYRFEEAGDAFVRALRLAPGEVETKRALELAREAAAASRASKASRRQAAAVGAGGTDDALLSLLRRA
ncbi:MAG TPA: VWA domain-containing protein, partial [Magnetospirillaceae bacterium]|nr:VWA domain-containing protein [Magnetospirillaceae bacterium]